MLQLLAFCRQVSNWRRKLQECNRNTSTEPSSDVRIVRWTIRRLYMYGLYTVSPKKWAPKHFATATANLHRFKWNFTHTRRHLFLSSTSNFIRIPYSVYEMFNSFKLMSQISVTDTTYFLLTSSVVTGAMETQDLWVMLFKNSYFSKVKADLYETT